MGNISLYDEQSDENLQKMAAAGDNTAEDRLSIRYSRLVRVCARPYFLAGGDSEDLTQEGMLGLLYAVRGFDSNTGAPFRSYAEMCIKHRLITAVKSSLRLKHAPLNDGISLDEILSYEKSSREADFPKEFRRIPEEQVLARESADEIIKSYSRWLSKFEAQILRLFLDGLTYKEMAEHVNRPQKSVDNAVQRIKYKLARHLNLGDFG